MTDNLPANGEIITLEKQQLKQAATVLTRAFFDDPLFLYWYPDSEERARRAPSSFLSALRYARRYGINRTTTPDMEGVTVWFRPGCVDMTTRRLLLSGAFRHIFGFGYRASLRMSHLGRHMTEMHHLDAPFPHWYLQIIGVVPEHQGKGHGGRLLRDGLERAERDNLPCYLTTNKEENVGFYEHHGFEVIREFIVPKTYFKNWSLLRK